jgi:cytoskeleton protein RodZ
MAERKKPKPDPEAADIRPPNETVGATLRAARQERGLEIEAVSQVIHIRSAQLKALEDDNIESLPGMTYAIGFVRSYANFLGLNGAEIVHRFKAEHGHTPPANAKLSFPEPIAESRVPDPMMVGVGAFLAVVILVGWTIYSNMNNNEQTAENLPDAPVVTSVTDSLPATTTDTASGTTAEQTGATGTAAPAVPAAEATAAGQAPATTSAAQQQATAPTTAATAPATPAAEAVKEPSARGTDDDEAAAAKKAAAAKESDESGIIKIKSKSRITLKATDASWIQVTDAQGKIVYRKVLRPGEQYSAPDQPGLVLDTANAGALQIIIDGKKIPALGKNGDIMRGIPLDPQELK